MAGAALMTAGFILIARFEMARRNGECTDDGVIEQGKQAGFRPRSLDVVNFLLAAVPGALGPSLNVFLITQQHWSQTEVKAGALDSAICSCA